MSLKELEELWEGEQLRRIQAKAAFEQERIYQESLHQAMRTPLPTLPPSPFGQQQAPRAPTYQQIQQEEYVRQMRIAAKMGSKPYRSLEDLHSENIKPLLAYAAYVLDFEEIAHTDGDVEMLVAKAHGRVTVDRVAAKLRGKPTSTDKRGSNPDNQVWMYLGLELGTWITRKKIEQMERELDLEEGRLTKCLK